MMYVFAVNNTILQNLIFLSAIKDAVKSMVASGINNIVYDKNGKPIKRSIESVVRSTVLTGVSQLSDKITWENIRTLEAKHVLTSMHDGARETHQPWQGRVFALNGSVDEVLSRAEENKLEKELETAEKREEKAILKNELDRQKEIDYNKKVVEIRELIKSDETNKKLNIGNQNKHFIDSKNYQKDKSYIFGDMETAQNLINSYYGTGKIKLDNKGKWIKKEFINHSENIGYYINIDTKEKELTNRFSIHYGKNGTHIVPARRLK